MSRGYFDFIGRDSIYRDLEKAWHVEIVRSTFFWFDLIVDPPEGDDYQKIASEYLKALKKAVENSADKRFVYFLAARKRVRFSASKQPRYSFFGRKLIFYIEIGKDRLRQRLTFEVPKNIEMPAKPCVSGDGRFLLWPRQGDREPVSQSIHEFLNSSGFRLGIDTEIHYVGSTDDPADRPLKREHRGYSDFVHKINPEEDDIFVYYNLFKVVSIAAGSAPINFAVANSVIDEIKKRKEGEILEHCLVHYFSTKTQEVNRKNEYGRLRNDLSELWREYKIKSVTFDMEIVEPSEYFRFFSRNVAPSDVHAFSCAVVDGKVVISEPVDVMSYFRSEG